MEEEKVVQVQFSPEEIQFYKMIQRHCISKEISMTNYIKGLIKKDLAWGHFAKRKKSDAEKKE